MKKMFVKSYLEIIKKMLCLSLVVLVLVGCTDPGNTDSIPKGNGNLELTTFYVNDTHGSIVKESSSLGLSNIGYEILKEKESNPNVLTIAGGDMFQGSALSNSYFGYPIIELMNEIGFDCMVIGNHEFDWGIDKVLQYFDGNVDNGEATFPLLAANIERKDNHERLENTLPYIVKEYNGVKVGIIGTIGEGLEGSISARFVTDYTFVSVYETVKTYSKELHTVEKCDLVLSVSHDDGRTGINIQLASLTGDYRVDGIFNAHSHQKYLNKVQGIIEIQSSSNSKCYGKVVFNIESHSYIDYSASNLTAAPNPNAALSAIIKKYTDEMGPKFSTEIIKAGENLSQGGLTSWISKLIRVKTGAVFAVHNYSGTRQSVSKNEVINLNKLYAIMPFDNVIKTCKLKGKDIKDMIAISNFYDYYSLDPAYSGLDALNNETYYLVATSDYIFDYEEGYNPFLEYGINHSFEGTTLRGIMQFELDAQKKAGNNLFTFSLPTILNTDNYVDISY